VSGWFIFIQLIINLGFVLGIFILWAKLNRPPKEDPRLSRGLQILQSKIAILEDLADKTDLQARQLTAILTAKTAEVQNKLNEADQHVVVIERSMQKSLEVSKIFEDKIPHKEIIERQTSHKYIEAARLAHQGQSAEDIATQLDLPLPEVQLVVSMNRERLIAEDQVVDFKEDISMQGESSTSMPSPIFSEEDDEIDFAQTSEETEELQEEAVAETSRNSELKIRPYEFPRIDSINKRV